MKQNLLKLGMICLMLVFSFIAKAVDIKEKAIYSTDFSEWKEASATKSESKVTVKNKYTKEAFDFILYNTEISSTNKTFLKLQNSYVYGEVPRNQAIILSPNVCKQNVWQNTL